MTCAAVVRFFMVVSFTWGSLRNYSPKSWLYVMQETQNVGLLATSALMKRTVGSWSPSGGPGLRDSHQEPVKGSHTELTTHGLGRPRPLAICPRQHERRPAHGPASSGPSSCHTAMPLRCALTRHVSGRSGDVVPPSRNVLKLVSVDHGYAGTLHPLQTTPCRALTRGHCVASCPSYRQ